jgi:anti-sigma B factor antagonist
MNRFALPEPFELQDVVCDGRHTLVVNGELDIASAGELNAMLLEIPRDEATGITLDLRGLTFMDSTGLFMVLFAQELAARHGYDFSVIPGSAKIQRIFELTALVDVLPFQVDDRNAVSLGGPTATDVGS